jgi:hypothetical protein
MDDLQLRMRSLAGITDGSHDDQHSREVKDIIQYAAEQRNILLERDEAESFLLAKKILKRNADHAAARTVIENFHTYMRTGCRPVSFAEFRLHEDEASR